MNDYIIRTIVKKHKGKYIYEYTDKRGKPLKKKDVTQYLEGFYIPPAYDEVKINKKKDSKVFQKIAKKFGKTIEELNSELQKRSYLLYEMQRRKIFDFEQNQKIINQYHKNPDAVLAAFGINIASNKTQ